MKIKLCVKVHKYAHMQIMDIRTIINNIIFVYIHWLGVCMFYMCSTVAACKIAVPIVPIVYD